MYTPAQSWDYESDGSDARGEATLCGTVGLKMGRVSLAVVEGKLERSNERKGLCY